MLAYEVDRGVLINNVAARVKVDMSHAAKTLCLPFNLLALRTIFGSDVYTQGVRPSPHGWDAETAYWLPLLALFTGARIGELAQLAPADVYEEEYFDSGGTAHRAWVMRITDKGKGQKIKNESSERRIPLHEELIKRGFIEFVRARNERRRIFATTPGGSGRESSAFVSWLGKWLRKTPSITDKRMTFHSFRHTFKDTARACSIPEEVHDAITGHAGKSVARRVYGGLLYPLAPLVDTIKQFKVPGLDIPIPPDLKSTRTVTV